MMVSNDDLGSMFKEAIINCSNELAKHFLERRVFVSLTPPRELITYMELNIRVTVNVDVDRMWRDADGACCNAPSHIYLNIIRRPTESNSKRFEVETPNAEEW